VVGNARERFKGGKRKNVLEKKLPWEKLSCNQFFKKKKSMWKDQGNGPLNPREPEKGKSEKKTGEALGAEGLRPQADRLGKQPSFPSGKQTGPPTEQAQIIALKKKEKKTEKATRQNPGRSISSQNGDVKTAPSPKGASQKRGEKEPG